MTAGVNSAYFTVCTWLLAWDSLQGACRQRNEFTLLSVPMPCYVSNITTTLVLILFIYTISNTTCREIKHVTYSYLQALGWDSILSWLHHRHLLVSSDIKVISALHITWIMFGVYLCIQCHTHKYKQMSKDCTRHCACTMLL